MIMLGMRPSTLLSLFSVSSNDNYNDSNITVVRILKQYLCSSQHIDARVSCDKDDNCTVIRWEVQ